MMKVKILMMIMAINYGNDHNDWGCLSWYDDEHNNNVEDDNDDISIQ